MIAKYLPAKLAGKYEPLAAGVIGALTSEDKTIEGRLKEGARDAATFWGMEKAGKLPGRLKRAAGSAAVAGGVAAISGGDAKQTTAAALMGGGFGAIGGEGKEKGSLTPEKAKQILEGGVGAVEGARDLIRQSVAPQNRGPEGARMARIIRANLPDVYRQADIADHALQEASKAFSRMPDDQRLSVIASIEGGGKHADPKMQGFIDTMREIHNKVRDELIAEASVKDPKTGEMKPTALKTVVDALNGPDEALRSYYENYFPHLFSNPDQAKEVMMGYYAGKRPLQGPATFLRQRKYPTIEEALSVKGTDGNPLLKLVTTDPVETYMLKWREMKRFTAAQRIIKEMNASHLGEMVPYGKRGPSGWVEIKDPAFWHSVRDENGEKVIKGKYWAPEPAARVLNNYLSPGLRKYAGYRGLMAINNTLNQAQLGWSGYHLGFTAVNSAMSKFSLGMEQAMQGKPLKGAGNMLKATAGLPWTVWETNKLGSEMRKEWLNPGSSKNPEIAQLVGMMEQGGGRATLDPIYRNNMAKKVDEVFRTQEKYWTLAYKWPMKATEKFTSLIMKDFVPLQKMGAFADIMRNELERMPEGATPDQYRMAAGKAWDAVDNRFGMLVYDNLFWDKTMKDLAMITFRSVGWNLGTLRELGGGGVDWLNWGKDLATKRHAEFTHRMGYTVALPAVAAMLGAVTNYLYTGEAPKSAQDYFFPRVGRKDEFGREERLSIPSYMKDVWHMAEGVQDVASGMGAGKLGSIVGGKIHPGISAIIDLMRNRDFFNTEIASPDDPIMKRAWDYAKFIGKEYTPLAAGNITREIKEKMPAAEIIGTEFGLTPAPADLKKTAAERLATELQGQRLPQAASTRAQRERQVLRRELEKKMRSGDPWQPFAQQGIDDGTLTEADLVYSANRVLGLPLDRTFRRMQLTDAVKVYNVGNAEEKARLWPILKDRVDNNPQQIQNAMEKMDAEQKRKFAKVLLEILQAPPPPAPPGK